MKEVTLKRTSRLNDGHLWIFSNEISSSLNHYETAELVSVKDKLGRFYGIGYINPHSLISIRLLTKEDVEIDEMFFTKRITDAITYRRKIISSSNAYRLIYSEGDFLPGLIVDIYNNCIVIQTLTAGMQRFQDIIIKILDDLVKPDCIVIKNDSNMRNLEGLPLYKSIVKGNLNKLPMYQYEGVLFELHPIEGQKTGGFLDQRINAHAFANYLKEGMVGLDVFCYAGQWGLHALKVASHVTFLDDSNHAIEMIKKNLMLNSVTDKASVVKSDAFGFLNENKDKHLYDFIILDPPAFVKNKNKVKEAINGYKEINALAMKCVKKGGFIATSSCSHHISREMFLDILRMSAKQVGRVIRVIEIRGQAPDHPILLSMPETEYLKCVFLEVM
ncbi:MAG: class I SAM-dependent rRNA methyltransferase [Thermodesulfovibrionales bacterium]|nr:class I SAM-dependent rRNA methyltransferase [Thermodesulfovibrionales bacterium]